MKGRLSIFYQKSYILPEPCSVVQNAAKQLTRANLLFYFYFFFGFYFLSPMVLLAEQPNEPNIEMLHVFVRANVNEVYFRNIWVFKRQDANLPWDVSIDLPYMAIILNLDEPNEMEFATSPATIRKRMAAESLIDSVGFSFALPNQDGTCRTQISPKYRVHSMMVSVSGPDTQLISDILKPYKYRQSHLTLPKVYRAGDLAAGTEVEINLQYLPCKDSNALEIVCIVGLGLIIIISLFTMYYKRKIKVVKSASNEACFE